MQTPTNILGLTFDEFQERARSEVGSGVGVAGDVYRRVMREGRWEPEAFGLSPRSVERWRASFCLQLAQAVETRAEPSPHGPETFKAVLAHPHEPQREYECVHIPMGRQRTSLCVSSQVGCRMACRFCETARMGLRDQLSAAEIVGQVVWARSQGFAPQSVVFMGMGEALDNIEAVTQALRVLNDRRGLALAQDKLTICTVGHVPGIRRLARLGWKRLNLSLSLNAPDDALRDALMPRNRHWPLAEVHAALRAYRQRDNFQLGINYCLMPGINDDRRHAAAVAEFCAGLGRLMVYLIPYNPGSVPITRAPNELEVARFVGWLREEGLPVRRRVTKGRDVMAACGQLGNPQRVSPHGRK